RRGFVGERINDLRRCGHFCVNLFFSVAVIIKNLKLSGAFKQRPGREVGGAFLGCPGITRWFTAVVITTTQARFKRLRRSIPALNFNRMTDCRQIKGTPKRHHEYALFTA
ncbi:MAG: hypothetical protein IKE45_02025, partial [Halomonas sp.]